MLFESIFTAFFNGLIPLIVQFLLGLFTGGASVG